MGKQSQLRVQAPSLPAPHPGSDQPRQHPFPEIWSPAKTGALTLLQLKPTHRLGRRFLLVHRQGPRVGGHGPRRRWDAGAGGLAGWHGAIVGSRGSQQARLRRHRGGSHSLRRWGPETARRSDVGGRAGPDPFGAVASVAFWPPPSPLPSSRFLIQHPEPQAEVVILKGLSSSERAVQPHSRSPAQWHRSSSHRLHTQKHKTITGVTTTHTETRSFFSHFSGWWFQMSWCGPRCWESALSDTG